MANERTHPTVATRCFPVLFLPGMDKASIVRNVFRSVCEHSLSALITLLLYVQLFCLLLYEVFIYNIIATPFLVYFSFDDSLKLAHLTFGKGHNFADFQAY